MVLLSDHMTDFDLGRASGSHKSRSVFYSIRFKKKNKKRKERKKQKEESPGNAQNSVELAPAAGHPNTSWSSSKKLVEIKQEDNAANGQTNEL